MFARQRSSSPNKSEPSPQQGCSGVTWRCCLQGWFNSGLTLIFASANWVTDTTLNSWSEKLHQLLGFSCCMKLKQLWDLRKIAWIHPETWHLWDRRFLAQCPPAHLVQVLGGQHWWKGVQPVPSLRWHGQQRFPSPWSEAHPSPQPSERVSSQCSFLSYFISPPKSLTFLSSPHPPPTKRWFLCLPRVFSAAAKVSVLIPVSSADSPQPLFVPLFLRAALKCSACRLTFAQHHCWIFNQWW